MKQETFGCFASLPRCAESRTQLRNAPAPRPPWKKLFGVAARRTWLRRRAFGIYSQQRTQVEWLFRDVIQEEEGDEPLLRSVAREAWPTAE